MWRCWSFGPGPKKTGDEGLHFAESPRPWGRDERHCFLSPAVSSRTPMFSHLSAPAVFISDQASGCRHPSLFPVPRTSSGGGWNRPRGVSTAVTAVPKEGLVMTQGPQEALNHLRNWMECLQEEDPVGAAAAAEDFPGVLH